ncbi:hypothetical protein GN958_ATG21908 [Phytophthora infestans]|uniref:Uncharacterized protein n=1 Tax=Phytophthora infestans TaxID=4787 RepID=A0A8S9TKC4_PHYIN|nr:hypothetical protein GN958_ATG21908 [Phytophthora infestans]
MLQAFKTVDGERALASLLYEAKGKLDPKKTAETLKSELYAEWFERRISERNFFSGAFNIQRSQATAVDKRIRGEYVNVAFQKHKLKKEATTLGIAV